MAADPLQWIFVTGVVWFGIASVAVAALATVLWFRTRRENPGHLVLWTLMTYTGYYILQLLDWGFWLRDRDGVEFPWTRGFAQLVAYTLFSWMVAMALWLDWNDVVTVIEAHVAVAGLLWAGDFTGGPKGWYWWAAALATLVLAQAFLLRKARQNSFKAWVMWFGWLVFALGTPVGQAFGWTLGRVLDAPPERKNTEIYSFVITAVGLALYGGAMTWAYSKRPSRTQPSTRPVAVLFPGGSAPGAPARPAAAASTPSATMTYRTPYAASTRS